MNRVWKPLDVGGLRLYRVVLSFPNHETWNSYHIVAAKSPQDASNRLFDANKGRMWSTYAGVEVKPVYKAYALDVLIPEDWWEHGVPCVVCDTTYEIQREQKG